MQNVVRVRRLCRNVLTYRHDLKKNPGYGRALTLQKNQRAMNELAREVRSTFVVLEGETA